MMRIPYTFVTKDLDVCHVTFQSPDLTTFCRLDGLGLEVIGQHLEPNRAVMACRVAETDDWCQAYGCAGVLRDTVARRLAHLPLGWRPTMLAVRVRGYRCTGCGRVWRQDPTVAAEPRARLSRGGLRWALEGIVVQHLTAARVAEVRVRRAAGPLFVAARPRRRCQLGASRLEIRWARLS